MSIVRVGLAETKNFSDGYDLIFGKKDEPKKDEQAGQKADTPEKTEGQAPKSK